MGSRKPPPQTLTGAQREAAAAALRELAKAAHASAGDAWIHVQLVGDLGALLARLTSRLPPDWGPHASARMTEALSRGANPADAVRMLLYAQTLIAGAINPPGSQDAAMRAAGEAHLASQSLLAASIAPSPARRDESLADADTHLAASHTYLAGYRRRPPVSGR